MASYELKFLFEGIIFTSTLHVLSDDVNQKEVMIVFSTKYLINNFQKMYKFCLVNNQFKAIYPNSQKERELIDALQMSLLSYFKITSRKFVSMKSSISA